MAKSTEEKLKNFAGEVTGEARQICEQIDGQAQNELQEKTKEGKEKILSESREYILIETERIKKEKSLEISKANIKSKQDYFKYGDEVSSRVFERVQKKLAAFMESEAYASYLLECCKKEMEKTEELRIYYMPEDEKTITEKVKPELGFDTAKTEFIKDETIKMGGLRFFDPAKNTLINEAFDQKTERAKELLNSIVSPHFTSVK